MLPLSPYLLLLMGKKENHTLKSSRIPDDKVITDLIEQRKLQQEALIKIMTSMDKNTGLPQSRHGLSKKKGRFGPEKST